MILASAGENFKTENDSFCGNHSIYILCYGQEFRKENIKRCKISSTLPPFIPFHHFAICETGNLLWPYIHLMNAKFYTATHKAFSFWLSESWLPGLPF